MLKKAFLTTSLLAIQVIITTSPMAAIPLPIITLPTPAILYERLKKEAPFDKDFLDFVERGKLHERWGSLSSVSCKPNRYYGNEDNVFLLTLSNDVDSMIRMYVNDYLLKEKYWFLLHYEDIIEKYKKRVMKVLLQDYPEFYQ